MAASKRTRAGVANTLDRVTFGKRLRSARKQFGWTLARLAALSGVSITTISRAERGQLALSYEKFSALGRRAAHGHGVDVRRSRRAGEAVRRAGAHPLGRGRGLSRPGLFLRIPRHVGGGQADEPDPGNGTRTARRRARRFRPSSGRGVRLRAERRDRRALRQRRDDPPAARRLAVLRQPHRPRLCVGEPPTGPGDRRNHQREQHDADGARGRGRCSAAATGCRDRRASPRAPKPVSGGRGDCESRAGVRRTPVAKAASR